METSLEKIIKQIKPENKIFVDLSLDIREQVLYILAHHPSLKNQKDLAKKMRKSESEVSKLINGLHNLTIESIAKLQAVLGEEIIMTDLKAKNKYLRFKKESEFDKSYISFKVADIKFERRFRHLTTQSQAKKSLTMLEWNNFQPIK